MFESIRHQMMFHGPLTGEIESHEGDIYIAKLINEYGEVVEKHDNYFPSLFSAREWLEKHGAKSFDLKQSNAYHEMINN
ncbi:MAG: hypothetical protein AseanaTS_25040 [Candidatus Pelagadaptatus aseana]|uniref:DUF6482 family protein n=1 Tax=Candidatus Pelagadaptatus aseana TaxID=3120508 RepID=UPI0039B2FFEC